MTWQKSSFSSGDVPQSCIEVAAKGAGDGRLYLRESELPRPVLVTDRVRLAALLAAVRR
ncbi:DUF397 domain-containing protein [Streptomyces aidingensis]|uniref:DUF397 domain-containing protein n=1 Tax=Streptomyces aidingensis TaxID=910347 RepID=A0A1I1DYV2_9ACTN|nr:DUF397 domain-containing protein [Streptomyces aidingensis]SFB80229.1 protein of unknown function [Streptomyces aidingensis]